MVSNYPDIKRGTRWEQTQARQWQNLTRDVQGPASIQAGPGILINRAGQGWNLSLWPSILQLLTRRLPQPSAAAAGNTEKFQVMNDRDREGSVMHDDWFYAERPSTGEVDIKIAKPHKLQVTPWNGRTVRLNEFSVYVKYSNYSPATGARRRATQVDADGTPLFPFIQRLEMIWPEYGTNRDSRTAEDIIKAVQIGEEATGIEGVDWEDTNDSARVWTVLPLGFLP